MNVGNFPCRYLTQDPAIIHAECNRLAFTYDVLEKISWVALTALLAVAFTVYYTGISLGGPVGALAAVSLISVAVFLPKFRQYSVYYEKQARIEGKVAEKLKQISVCRTSQIKKFIVDQGLSLEQIPREQLQQINPRDPLRALLPLLARYKCMKEDAKKAERAAKAALAERFENVANENQRDEVFFKNQFLATQSYEAAALPALIKTAAMLRMIQDPSVDIPIDSESWAIPGLGVCKPKAFGMRQYYPIYFDFDPKLNRRPLTLAEIEENLDPRALYQKLFLNR